jgi:hypothetical protein
MGGGNPVSKIVKGATKLVKSAVKAVSKVVSGIVSAVTSPFGMNIDVPDYDIGQDQAQAIQGVLLNKDSAIANVPVVYGTRQVGGIRVFVSTNGTNNEYLYLAFVLCEGQINAFQKLYVDDNEVTLSSYAHGTTATASGRYADRLSVQFFDGRDDQTVSTLLQGAPGWTSNHRLRGLAYLALRFRWKKIESQEDSDNNPYSGGIPQIRVQIQGKKIFNLTTGYTPASFGTITSGGTINSQGTLLNKSITAGVSQGLLSQSITKPTAINFSSARNDASLKISLAYEYSTNTTGYAQCNLGVLVFKNGSLYRPNDTGFETRPVRMIPPRTTTVTYEHTFTNLTTADTWTFYPFVDVADLNGTTFGTLKITAEVPTPEFEEHATAYAAETVAYSNNPVNVLLDYLRNGRFGKGLDNNKFDWISWRRAALQCDQTVTYSNGTTSKAFTSDAVLETANSLMINAKIVLAGFRGIMPYQQGRYFLKIENGGDDTDITATPAVPAVAFTVTNDHIIGGLQIEGESKEHKCNRCVITYVDPSADYEPNDVIFPEDGSALDTQWLAEDNGVRLEKRVTLPTIANRKIAEQYARVFVKRSRTQKNVSLATNLATANTTVGDLIRVVNEHIGLDGVFRIMDMRIRPEGNIEISGIEHQSSIYGIDATGADYTRPTINLPDPYDVLAPISVTVQSGAAFNLTQTSTSYVGDEQDTIRRMLVSWTAPDDPFIRDYEIQYKQAADANYITAGSTTLTSFYVQPAALGEQYDIRVSARNELNRRSNFTSASRHTVVV